MKLEEIYHKAIELGVKNDIRKSQIGDILQKEQRIYNGLSDQDRFFYDNEAMINPYPDLRINYGNPDLEIRRILAGIDIDTQELLLASRLNDKGAHLDLVISHHPLGHALSQMYKVIPLQIDHLKEVGIPVTQAEAIMQMRKKEVELMLLGKNHFKTVDAARVLDLPLLSCHTPADNCVHKFLTKLFQDHATQNLADIIDLLLTIPEYKSAAQLGSPPKILFGKDSSRIGKLYIEITGGAFGFSSIYEKLAQYGIGTILGSHVCVDHFKEAKKHNINMIIAGHMASDSLGLNLLFDAIFEAHDITIVPTSGYIRIER